MAKLKIAYFGTPDFSAEFLEKLLQDKEIPVDIKFAVTQKDKKVGRKQILTPTPVKQTAEKYKIAVLYSSSEEQSDESRSSRQARTIKDNLSGVDLGLLFAYGEILPGHILNLPKYGFWNVHPSLLPLYRGPSPVAYPLMEGVKKTGVTLMKMDEQLDHGPIIAEQEVEIESKERRPELTTRLTNLGYSLFKQVILNLFQDPNEMPKRVRHDMFQEQEHKKATYTKLLTKQDGFIEISNLKTQINNSPQKLFNRFRGLYPWPGIWTIIREESKEKRLKITDMDLVDGKLILKKVQLEGKKEVDYQTFRKSYQSDLQ